VVGREELITRAWPNRSVEEGNLKFQIGLLRRALGDGRAGHRYIAAIPGRGDSFVAAVRLAEDAPSVVQIAATARKHNLPVLLTRLVGRDQTDGRLVGQLRRQRLLTIVGPGGIGKTSVALAVADALVEAYGDGVWLVDLAPLADPRLVLSAVASAIGMEVRSADPVRGLIALLRDERMLLVLENCEHVIDAAAAFALAILKGARGVHILATSREPLRVEGERVHRLSSLPSPATAIGLTAAEALTFPAVQLFIERAAASSGEFELSDADAPIVAAICQRLDGIPLAIEFAAARVDAFGVRGLAARLDDRLRLLTTGRRMAVPRHRTISATLDWSYSLLSEAEQTIFRRLAIFAGGFTLEAAGAVAADTDHPAAAVIELAADLVTKSLVRADVNENEPRLQLPETTRAYALQKLADSGECDAIARRHAAYYCDLFDSGAHESADADDRSTVCAIEIGNLRAALGWAFGQTGDPAVAVRLAAAAVPLWISTSMLAEGHQWMEKAMRSLDGARLRGGRWEMVLQATLGVSRQFAKAITAAVSEALSRALELAERLGDADYQLRIIHNLWIYHLRLGEVRRTLALAQRAEAVALSLADPVATTTVDRMFGSSLYCAGEPASARIRLERLLRLPPPSARCSYILRFGFDQLVVARYVLAHILWIQGLPDQAVRAGRLAVEEARELQHPLTLCGALASAAALSLRIGDLVTGRELSAEILERAERHSLANYHAYALALQDRLALQGGTSNLRVEEIRAALDRWHASHLHIYLTMSDFADVVADAGYVDEISAIVDETLERAELNQELWAFPEILRVKGRILLSRKEPDPDLAEEYFVRSLDRARAQGAPAWELRTAVSLALLKREQGQPEKGREALQAAYARFREGLDTADLKRASRLLDELGGPRVADAGSP
jgi:predicted ATPase